MSRAGGGARTTSGAVQRTSTLAALGAGSFWRTSHVAAALVSHTTHKSLKVKR